MKTTDTTERIQAIADTKYDGDTIKAAREVNFATDVYPNLVELNMDNNLLLHL